MAFEEGGETVAAQAAATAMFMVMQIAMNMVM